MKADLAQGIVTDETLDKTEKIYAEIDGFLTETDREGLFKETSDIFSTKEKKRYGIHRR